MNKQDKVVLGAAAIVPAGFALLALVYATRKGIEAAQDWRLAKKVAEEERMSARMLYNQIRNVRNQKGVTG